MLRSNKSNEIFISLDRNCSLDILHYEIVIYPAVTCDSLSFPTKALVSSQASCNKRSKMVVTAVLYMHYLVLVMKIRESE